MLTRKIGNILKILYFIRLDIFINIYIYILDMNMDTLMFYIYK